MEAQEVHRRIAIKVLLVIGTGPKRLLLGFLCTGTFLSMVTTNCATATMMVPVAKAVLHQLSSSREEKDGSPDYECNGRFVSDKLKADSENSQDGDDSSSSESESSRPMYLGCLLAVAYGTSIGGTGTLTGAAPNLILKAFIDERYPEYSLLTFSTWTLYNLPGMLLAILAAWLVLYFTYVRKSGSNGVADDRVRIFLLNKYSELGPIRSSEKTLGVLFLVLMVLWFFRSPGFMTGWADLVSYGSLIGNATPAVLVALLLFIIPSDSSGTPILDWKTAQERTPWGVLLLLGGGLALAHGAEKSGLMVLVTERLLGLSSLNHLLMLFSLCLLTLVTTEFLSNTSTASLFIPVINELAGTLGLHPLYLLLPVTICCSYAFMLPMATSPNAIVFQNSNMKTSDMALPGCFLNVLCCLVQVGLVCLLGNPIFALNEPMTTGSFDWATPAASVYNITDV